MLDFLRDKAVSLALAAIPIGGLVFLIVQWMKRTFTGIDEHSALRQRAYVIAGCAALAAISSAFGQSAPCDASAAVQASADCLANLPQEWVSGILKAAIAAVAAFVLHAGKGSASV